MHTLLLILAIWLLINALVVVAMIPPIPSGLSKLVRRSRNDGGPRTEITTTIQ